MHNFSLQMCIAQPFSRMEVHSKASIYIVNRMMLLRLTESSIDMSASLGEHMFVCLSLHHLSVSQIWLIGVGSW